MQKVGSRWIDKAADSTSKGTTSRMLALVDLILTIATEVIIAGTVFGIAALTDLGIIDKDVLISMLSLACPLVTMIQFVSPFPVVVDAVRKLNGQDLPLPVFQSQMLCNILALAYAIQIHNTIILTCNLFGLACQIIFLGCARLANQTKGQWLIYGMQQSVALNVILYFCAAVLPLFMLGHIITGFNLVLFAAPLTKLGVILRTRSAASLPLAMTLICGINNAIWTLYGALIQDNVVLVPSTCGLLLSTFQILLLLWCHHKLPFDLAFLLLPFSSSDAPPTSKDAEATKLGSTVDHWAEPEWEKQGWDDKELE